MIRFDRGLILVFVATLIPYYLTLCPTVYTGDSGDFITASYTLGIPHPGGYPLYMILGKLFSLIPLGSVAYRYNLMSAVFTSLAASCCYLIAKELFSSERAAIGAGLLAGLSRSIWDQATIAEAYALNGFFVVLVTLLAIRYRKEPNSRNLAFIFFAFGLSLTNHISMLFYLPAFAYLVADGNKKALEEQDLKKHILAFVAPLAIYAYLPIRAMSDPPYNWGNPDNLSRFLRHVTGAVHRRTYVLSLPADELFERFWGLVTSLATQISFGFALVIIGVYGRGGKEKTFIRFTGIIAAADIAYTLFFNEASLDVTTFGIPTALILAVWTGAGFSMIFEYVNKTKTLIKEKQLAKSVLVVLACIIALYANYDISDRSENLIAYDFANNLIKTVEYDMKAEGFSKALIFAQGDNVVFPLYYMTLVEKPNSGISVIEETGFISHDFYGADFIWLDPQEHERIKGELEYDAIMSGTAVYYTIKPDIVFPGHKVEQRGLLYRVIPDDTTGSYSNYWELYDYRQVWNTTIKLDLMTKSLQSVYYVRFAQYHLDFDKPRAAYLLGMALKIRPDDAQIRYDLGNIFIGMQQYPKAIEQFEISLRLDPENAKTYNNMGFAYSMMDEVGKARAYYKTALKKNPRYTKARSNLAGLLTESQAFTEAVQHYNIVIKEDPDNARAYFNLGRIAFANENYEVAGVMWDKYLELEPDGPMAGEVRDYVEKIDAGMFEKVEGEPEGMVENDTQTGEEAVDSAQ